MNYKDDALLVLRNGRQMRRIILSPFLTHRCGLGGFAAAFPQCTNTSTAACSADFTTSSNFRSLVSGAFNFADTSGTDSRKLSR